MTSQAQERAAPTQRAWTIACRDAHLDDVQANDVWSAMKTIGAEGVEVIVDKEMACPHLFHPDQKYAIATKEDRKRLAAALAEHNVRITAFCLMNHFDEQPDAEVAFTTKVAEAAKELHAPALRLDFVPRKLKDEKAFLELSIDVGRQIISQTDGTGVRFGVENHGRTTNKPEFLRPFFKGIGSERFGLTMDTGNFYWYGWPLEKLYEIYAEFAPAACHTHCKSIAYPPDKRNVQREIGWEYGKYCCPVYEGDIDFKKVAAILRKAGYQGDLCIENESLGRAEASERGDILKKEVTFLRSIAEQTG